MFIVSVIVQSNCHILQEHRWHLAWMSAAGRRAVTRENVTFIEPHMWPPNSPDLNPVDCAACGAFQLMVYQRRPFKTTS